MTREGRRQLLRDGAVSVDYGHLADDMKGASVVMTFHHLPPSEHDFAMGSQMEDLSKRGLDSALKLSLLSEAWILAVHGSCSGDIGDFSSRLGYADDIVHQALNQLTHSGYFVRCLDNRLRMVYRLTDHAPRPEMVRRLLSSWRDLRFYLRADALATCG